VGFGIKNKRFVICLFFLLVLFFGLFVYAQVNAPKRAFYFWQTTFKNSSLLESVIRTNHLSTIYLRFFDVEWDSHFARPKPVASLDLMVALPLTIKVIPVVFIRNEVFVHLKSNEIKKFSKNVFEKMIFMGRSFENQIIELQFDCDWSDQTRSKYFSFLEEIAELKKHLSSFQHWKISATIRLHQVKYSARTGVPPVDRGMLMFYNMGDLQLRDKRNSIFNREDALKYTSFISKYKLPLDVALAVFSWSIHERDQMILGLYSSLTVDDITANSFFIKESGQHFKAKMSHYFHGVYYIKGDSVKFEGMNPQETLLAAKLLISSHGFFENFSTVALFDLNERMFKEYGTNGIEKIFGIFNKI